MVVRKDTGFTFRNTVLFRGLTWFFFARFLVYCAILRCVSDAAWHCVNVWLSLWLCSHHTYFYQFLSTAPAHRTHGAAAFNLHINDVKSEWILSAFCLVVRIARYLFSVWINCLIFDESNWIERFSNPVSY